MQINRKIQKKKNLLIITSNIRKVVFINRNKIKNFIFLLFADKYLNMK